MLVVEQSHVIDFIKENIIHIFGLLETIMVDKGSMLMGE